MTLFSFLIKVENNEVNCFRDKKNIMPYAGKDKTYKAHELLQSILVLIQRIFNANQAP